MPCEPLSHADDLLFRRQLQQSSSRVCNLVLGSIGTYELLPARLGDIAFSLTLQKARLLKCGLETRKPEEKIKSLVSAPH
jgi:hypothetical protein